MYIIDRMAIESSPSAFCTTAGRLVMVPVPRMATFGCATIGVSNSAPPDPVLVIVNVAPDRSSGPRSLLLAREPRSEEHTSELQSRGHLVCRLLLEKKKTKNYAQL